MTENEIARFDTKYVAVESGCWEWKKKGHAGSYPSFFFGGRYGKAHRASFSSFVGAIPTGVCVLHTCDNRLCVNPGHLFLGSKRDNAQDLLSKGRGGHNKNPARGETTGTSKLSTEDVLDIRRRHQCGESQASVANIYGVGAPAVFKIVHRIRWAHI